MARYYERNTSGFLTRGQGGSVGAIHRAVWAPGVNSRAQAFHYVHDVLRAHAEANGVERTVDLGCGTGAGLARVLDDTSIVGFGVTNSAQHAALARARLGGRAEIHELDFCSDPLPDSLDFAFGVESFVHGGSPESFFGNVARALVSGGCLALCDDFLATEDRPRPVRAFESGWLASSLSTPVAADEAARREGLELEEDRDWTPLLELDRPRDRLLRGFVALATPLGARGDRFRSLSGGSALRTCLKRGWIRYRYRVWRKA